MTASTQGIIIHQPPTSGKPAPAANPELTTVDALQLLMNLAGMAPGAVPGLLNATLSVARGDFVGAGLSASSAIPAVSEVVGAARLLKNPENYAQAIGVVATNVLPKLPESMNASLKSLIDTAKRKLDDLKGPQKESPSAMRQPETQEPKSGQDTQIKAR